MFEDEKEEPASVIVTNVRGEGYDIKNIPGFKRKQLIESGDISIESFVQADNMPGSKLKKLRDRFKLSNNMGTRDSNSASKALLDINDLTVGSLVTYRKVVTEVKKINVKKGLVYINIKGTKDGWIGIDKLKPVNIPPVDEE